MRIKSFILLLFLSVPLFAQFTIDTREYAEQYGLEIYWTGELDSLGNSTNSDTLTSKLFDLSEYDGVDSLDYSYKFTSVLDSPKISIHLYGSDYSTSATSAKLLKTIVNKDSSEIEMFGSFDLSGIRAKSYWIKFTAEAGGRGDQTFKFTLKARKRDY